MAANPFIKNLPGRVLDLLHGRAARCKSPLQVKPHTGIEAGVVEDQSGMAFAILAEVRRLGVRTPGEAAALIRADRDSVAHS